MRLKKLNRSQKGMTLIEVLIAIAILGMIAVAFLGGLTTSYKAIIIADERTTAESLTRAQLEYVKSQGYNNSTAPAIYAKIAEVPGYDIKGLAENGYAHYPDEINYTYVSEDIIGVVWDAENGGTAYGETGTQIVTVVIYHEGRTEPVLTTTTYMVNR